MLLISAGPYPDVGGTTACEATPALLAARPAAFAGAPTCRAAETDRNDAKQVTDPAAASGQARIGAETLELAMGGGAAWPTRPDQSMSPPTRTATIVMDSPRNRLPVVLVIGSFSPGGRSGIGRSGCGSSEGRGHCLHDATAGCVGAGEQQVE